MSLTFLNNLSVRNRIWALVVLLIGGFMLGSIVNILMLRDVLWQEKEQKTRQLVESGYSVLTHFHERQLSGELSQDQAQAGAIGTIKAMRYDDTEYFWLNDLGTPFPRVIMHPTIPALDGLLLDSPQFNSATGLRVGTKGAFTATDGKMNLGAAFVQVVNQGGEGYVTYDWPKPKVGSGVTQQRYPKLSYVKKFAPWGWVIGSGVYVDDVDAIVRKQAMRNGLLVSGIGILLLILSTLIARSITRPLRQTIATMRAIGRNDGGPVLRLPVEGHSSEIDELALGFNDMLSQREARDAELANHRLFLEETVARRTAELHESEKKFSSICATAQDAIILIDKNCHISYWNLAAQKTFGYSPAQAVGRDLHELLAPERYREAFRRGFAKFCLTGEGGAVGKTVELMGLRRDGSEFPMELSISAIQLQDHWAAVGFVRDITERKHSEQEIQENRSRMRALLDATSESVLLLDPDGIILAINAYAAQRFDQVPETITGKNFYSFLSPELSAHRKAVVQQVFNTGLPLDSQDQRGAIFFNNSIYPVKSESGDVESVAVYAKDVTEQHRTKAVDDIFRHIDTVLLKWRMNLESIAQIFCDDILPVFDLAAAWIGRAEKEGQITLLASAEGRDKGCLDQLRTRPLRWNDEPGCCLPAASVIRSGQRKMGASADPQCADCSAVTHGEGTRPIMTLPLILRGETWGVLTLYGRDARQFESEPLQARLMVMAARLGTALESAVQQEWLTLLDAALGGVDNAVFITDANASVLWVNRAFIQLSGYSSDEILGKTPKLFSSGVQDADFYQLFWQTIKAGGTWHSDIVNARRDGSRYTVRQTVTPLRNGDEQVTHFVAILEDISQRKLEEERIQHSAQFDLLTDLPNRALFFDRLGQALALGRRDGLPGALMFLDLDHFKEVNDRLGHAAGDRLLIAVAARLREQVRESDTVARLGGDEFTVILPSLRDSADAMRVANNIIAAIGQPFQLAGAQAHIGVSIGIAIYPLHGQSAEEILNAADNAMYQAKNAGRNCYAMATVAAPSPATPVATNLDAYQINP